MAWQIKFDDASKKDLAKLDKQIAKRITEFLRERVEIFSRYFVLPNGAPRQTLA